MAAITWKDVVGHAKELDTVGTAAQTDYLALVNAPSELDVAGFGGEDGPRLKLARIYYAAHLATMDRRRGIAGAVTGTSLGPASRQYASGAGWEDELAQTSYGTNLLSLMKQGVFRAGLLI